MDITEQKPAEELRQENEVQQRLLNELGKSYKEAPVGLCYLDSDLRFLHVNDWLAKINGVPVEAHIGRTIREVLPDVAAGVEAQFRQVIETGEPIVQGRVHAETSAHPGVKKHYLHNYYPVKREDGTVVGLSCAVQDVTQLTETSEALQASERRYRALVEAVPDMLFRLKSDGTIVDFVAGKGVEPAIPSEEFLGKTAKMVLPTEMVDAPEVIDITLATGEVQTIDYVLPSAGVPTNFEARVARSGEEEVVWVARDITDRKKAEEERARLEEQLRQSQKMDAVGKLAGGIAHDFNNLLTAINGYSDLLLEGLKPDDRSHQGLTEIKKAGDRAAVLTRQLLAFARKQILQPKVIDLGEIVVAMEDMLRRLMGEHIEFVVHRDTDVKKVKADPAQMDQVVMNLLVNARDAMPQGGSITMSIENVALDGQASAALGDLPAGDYVMLSVRDIGVGMAEETLSHIFEPFFTTKGAEECTGLGLSTVFGIVKQSGGGIEVESEPGTGSTFRIYLPQVEASEPVVEEKKHLASAGEGCETIMVVEDEEIILELLKRTLEGLGYTILIAHHGEEALLTAGRHEGPIDLMITDVVMPQMSGHELAERLAPLRPEMSVLYMSGYSEKMVADQGLVDLKGQLLQKPFRRKDVANKIREILDKPVSTH